MITIEGFTLKFKSCFVLKVCIRIMKGHMEHMPQYEADVLYRLHGRMNRRSNQMLYVVAGVLAFGVFLTLVNIYELRRIQNDYSGGTSPTVEGRSEERVAKQHVVWIRGKRLQTGYLQHVFNVFNRIGYNIETKDTDFDVLWSHDYPFGKEIGAKMKILKPHQRVNHFPGSGYITNKVSLATSSIWFIPPAFKIPAQKDKLLEYAKKYPDKMWVQKSNSHRGIKIKKLAELDFKSDNTFIQEYVDKPFLIDKRKFDIGIYTILTSIDPLRVYVVEHEILLRFCPQDYYPFDPENVDKYVVGDDYTPTWKLPSLHDIYEKTEHTHKDTLNTYLRKMGRNDTKLWLDVKNAIMEVFLSKESLLISAAAGYKSTRNFFEMVRFDFVFDEDMHVYLMEVNMSPNLSSGHFAQNKLMYEQVIFNMLSLVGVARSLHNDLYRSYTDEINMQVSNKDIQPFTETCVSTRCIQDMDCRLQECQLCHSCLNFDLRLSLQLAYLEHVNKRNCRRVFPPPMSQQAAIKWTESGDEFYLKLSKKNKLIYNWFRGKCIKDISWCQ